MSRRSKGTSHLFKSRHFHFEALRAIAYAPYGGADVGEVLSAVAKISEENSQEWFSAWYQLAERTAQKANATADTVGRGRALLRTHNYYRTAEFYLLPEAKLASDAYDKSSSCYYRAMEELKVNYEIIQVPFQGKKLRAVYYPASSDHSQKTKPLIMGCSGFDGTVEELYFYVVAPALERGFDVLIYEGPGQSDALRKQNMTFIPEWEKPTGAVIDAFSERFGKPDDIVLLGISLGGILGARAAAFEPRISGFVAWDSMFDMERAACSSLPNAAASLIKWLLSQGHYNLLDKLLNAKAKRDVGAEWGINNGRWSFGYQRPSQCFDAFRPFRLNDVAHKITADVLLLWGEDDHFVDNYQLIAMQKGLTKANSVETISYTAEDGGQEHCQLGILTALHGDVFSWIHRKFPGKPERITEEHTELLKEA